MYNPYLKTAIWRHKLSKPMNVLLDKGILDNKSVIDIGCGQGEDVEILNKDKSIHIIGYDKYNEAFKHPYLLAKYYDVVTCNYCFNVIKDLKDHEELLKQIRVLGDEVYISVRSDIKAIKSNWIYIEENKCWKTSRDSYQRFYDEKMISQHFGQVEYIINNNSLKLFKLKKYNNNSTDSALYKPHYAQIWV